MYLTATDTEIRKTATNHKNVRKEEKKCPHGNVLCEDESDTMLKELDNLLQVIIIDLSS